VIEIKLTVLVLAAIAAVVLFLYFSPFAACRGCRGKRCRRCRGLGRYQRRGSRTVHQLAARIRGEIDRARAERAGKRSNP
jgi:hypothetical protein